MRLMSMMMVAIMLSLGVLRMGMQMRIPCHRPRELFTHYFELCADDIVPDAESSGTHIEHAFGVVAFEVVVLSHPLREDFQCLFAICEGGPLELLGLLEQLQRFLY